MSASKTLLSSGRTPADVCRAAELGDEALKLLDEHTDAKQFVERLVAGGQPRLAIAWLAHALPERPAVWWAWFCARHAHGEAPPQPIVDALEAIKTWIAEPTDANRRKAMRHGEAVKFDVPAGCAALAAFFSGGSIGPPDRDAVPPPPNVAGKIISGCVLLSAVFTEPEKADDKLKEFARHGLEVADKTQLWTAPR